MPFQPINFAGIRPVDNGMGDLLTNALMGYKASQEPAKMAVEQQKRQADLAKALLENKYAPRRNEAELKKLDLVNQFFPEEKRAQIEGQNLLNIGRGLENQYLPRHLESKISSEEASAMANKAKAQQLQHQMQLLRDYFDKAQSGQDGNLEVNEQDPFEVQRRERMRNAAAFGNIKDLGKIASEANPSKLPTTSNITKYQVENQAIDNAIPLLRELKAMKVPFQATLPSIFSPDEQAAYKGKAAKILETVMAAFSLPNTASGIKKAEDIIYRKNLESDEAYGKRIDDEIENLLSRKQGNLKFLGRGGNKAESVSGGKISTYNGKSYVKKEDGKWYPQ